MPEQMRKFTIQVIGLLAVTFIAMFLIANQQLLNKLLKIQDASETISLKINNALLNVEVADTQAKRNKGFSGRSSLASDSGMLFVFDKYQIYQFWMKKMLIPIDIIWLKDSEVVDVNENLQPPLPDAFDNALQIYKPKQSINMVLEVVAGFVKKHNIKIGDTIEVDQQ